MSIYWFLYAFPIVGHLLAPQLTPRQERLLWLTLTSAWILVIGLREDIGCDWNTYLAHFNNIENQFFGRQNASDPVFSFLKFISQWFTGRGNDPGYTLLILISSKVGSGIYGVNLISAAIIVGSLSMLCRKMALPWIAWLVATPYFLIVVSMGYSRQAIAVSLTMLGFAYLQQNQNRKFVGLILLAVCFHKSAAFFLPIALLILPSRFFCSRWVFVLATGRVVVILFLARAQFYSYIGGLWESQGAIIRAAMNLLPGLLIIFTSRRTEFRGLMSSIWIILSWIAILFFLFASFATTPIDRIGIYLISLQIFAASHFPIWWKQGSYQHLLTAAIISLYGLVQFTWLTFAHNRHCWREYKNILFLFFS